ncbi:MAG: helix-turn-helix transcriptional regulator [Sutterella sp.]|uniref:helix-turn-helix transcriptional regulator n=1 Tax=Duodenibacillus massiliensis TaxID=1852381 RepID=UPI00093CD52F|nr:helix-turn-helix transcriptional regulator [Duodenibacillus massiliensis]MBS5793015.1 helix-turn-helix transcriptional regulator [Sutterella sp.]
MSERTLTRPVKRETGLSLADWILSIRLLGAVNDLTNGETVEETAWNADYETPSAFIRRFHRLFGMTPGQFRSEQTA